MSGKGNKYFELSEMFKSIAHPDRLSIIQLMCSCGCQRMTVKSIYEKLKMEQPTVSRHLSIMRKSGLMDREQEGNNTYYRLHTERESVNCITRCFKK